MSTAKVVRRAAATADAATSAGRTAPTPRSTETKTGLHIKAAIDKLHEA